MSSIKQNGETYHGISVNGRGAFTNPTYGLFERTYAGLHRDGHACGLGVLTWYSGPKFYADHGPDGKYDGRYLGRWTNGETWYRLYERGKETGSARVSADGTCKYNDEDCARNDPRLLALTAQVTPVEVHPTRPNAIIG
jgi:hypothetical protein